MRTRRVHLTMRTEGIKAFSNRYGVVVWTGENDMKTVSVDPNLFENGAKQLPFRLKIDPIHKWRLFSFYSVIVQISLPSLALEQEFFSI